MSIVKCRVLRISWGSYPKIEENVLIFNLILFDTSVNT